MNRAPFSYLFSTENEEESVEVFDLSYSSDGGDHKEIQEKDNQIGRSFKYHF